MLLMQNITHWQGSTVELHDRVGSSRQQALAAGSRQQKGAAEVGEDDRLDGAAEGAPGTTTGRGLRLPRGRRRGSSAAAGNRRRARGSSAAAGDCVRGQPAGDWPPPPPARSCLVRLRVAHSDDGIVQGGRETWDRGLTSQDVIGSVRSGPIIGPLHLYEILRL